MSDAASSGFSSGVFSGFERLVALRYLRPRRQGRAMSATAVISLIGVTVGVFALIVVMSVMNGMRHEVLSQILGIDPHVRIENPDGLLKDYDGLAERLQKVPGVLHAMPVIAADVMVVAQGRSEAATARGEKLADLQRYSAIDRYLIAGRLDAAADEIVISDRIAGRLGVGPGDEVTLVAPNPDGKASTSMPTSSAFRVAALFAVKNDRYADLLYMPLRTAQRYFAMPDAVTSVDVTVADPEAAATMKGGILQAIGASYRVRDWQDLNAAFVFSLQVERTVTFILLALVVVVAAFNIVSGQVMLVKDKGREIAILRTMGATRSTILRIFFLSGAAIGVVGTIIGLAIGLAIAGGMERIGGWLARIKYDLPWGGVVDFLSQVPAIVDFAQVAFIVALALALSFAATLYPAWRAARLDPVEALRYE